MRIDSNSESKSVLQADSNSSPQETRQAAAKSLQSTTGLSSTKLHPHVAQTGQAGLRRSASAANLHEMRASPESSESFADAKARLKNPQGHTTPEVNPASTKSHQLPASLSDAKAFLSGLEVPQSPAAQVPTATRQASPASPKADLAKPALSEDAKTIERRVTEQMRSLAADALTGFESYPKELRPSMRMMALSLGLEYRGPDLSEALDVGPLEIGELTGLAKQAARVLHTLAESAKPRSMEKALSDDRSSIPARLLAMVELMTPVMEALRHAPVKDLKDPTVSACVASCQEALEQLDPENLTDGEKCIRTQVEAAVSKAFFTIEVRLEMNKSTSGTLDEVLTRRATDAVKAKGFPLSFVDNLKGGLKFELQHLVPR